MAPIDKINNMFSTYTTGLTGSPKVGGQQGTPKVVSPKKTEGSEFGSGSAWAGFTGKMLCNNHSCFNAPNPTYEAAQAGKAAGVGGAKLYLSA